MMTNGKTKTNGKAIKKQETDCRFPFMTNISSIQQKLNTVVYVRIPNWFGIHELTLVQIVDIF